MPLEQLLSILPPIKPRIYSIASDARYSPKAVEFTIVINQWKAKTGELKTGTCTKFIQDMPVGKQVACAVVCGTFQFPEKDTTPMVMVGCSKRREFSQNWLEHSSLTSHTIRQSRSSCLTRWPSSLSLSATIC
eukprot:g13299.t1